MASLSRPSSILALIAITTLAACTDGTSNRQRDDSYDPGPTQKGDELATFIPFTGQPADDGDPPPPPLDTLATLVASTDDGVDVVAELRGTYYREESGDRGWIAFAPERQLAGVQSSPNARIILRGNRMGGFGTLTLPVKGGGTVTIDLAASLRATGSELAGSCSRREGGACGDVGIGRATFTDRAGRTRFVSGVLEIGTQY